MANNRRPFYWKLSSANIMPDGMLKGISYGDYALMMAVQDKFFNEGYVMEQENNEHDEIQY
ncbi:hypothetical protein DW1_0355 [Proteiniborus sp. DW1]|uniref:hypothetical protein n=1 Tax=Proteiniborus sp. DW1 TaxID=1889883 RepID=UPI00092DFB7E|nr:hypothetical protein [Proteiniborus sp. DW1]SCG81975.1 hypothetical protein DW1_0355 [Proteiniborus sp. DW1]